MGGFMGKGHQCCGNTTPELLPTGWALKLELRVGCSPGAALGLYFTFPGHRGGDQEVSRPWAGSSWTLDAEADVLSRGD